MGGSNGELENLTDKLANRARAHEMEVNTEKSKIMMNRMSDISANISMNGQKFEKMSSFKYLEATLCKESSCPADSTSVSPQ